MRISDWSSDVCSSDLVPSSKANLGRPGQPTYRQGLGNLAVDQIDRAVSGAATKAGSHRPPQYLDLVEQERNGGDRVIRCNGRDIDQIGAIAQGFDARGGLAPDCTEEPRGGTRRDRTCGSRWWLHT